MFDLCDYTTAERIRSATLTEAIASVIEAGRDGGAGVIIVDEQPCYVVGDADVIRAEARKAGIDA